MMTDALEAARRIIAAHERKAAQWPNAKPSEPGAVKVALALLACHKAAPSNWRGIGGDLGVPSGRVSRSDEHSATLRWRKKPSIVEARRWNGLTGVDALHTWSNAKIYSAATPGALVVVTLHGTTLALPGDWIIRGEYGDFWPCKPDIFAATYEPAGDAREPDTRGEANPNLPTTTT